MDIDFTISTDQPMPAVQIGFPGIRQIPSQKGKGKEKSDNDDNSKTPSPIQNLASHPPSLASSSLRSVVNILDAPDCSSKTFQQAITLIQNLSHLPGAREIISTELQARCKSYGVALYPELSQLEEALNKASNADQVQVSILSKFSPASSLQAKLLRLLKTIDYTYHNIGKKPSTNVPANASSTAQDSASSNSNTDNNEPKTSSSDPFATSTALTSSSSSQPKDIQSIYEDFQFGPLWEKVGKCLTIIAEKSDMIHIVTILLPLIEALMVIASSCGIKPIPTVSSPPTSPVIENSLELPNKEDGSSSNATATTTTSTTTTASAATVKEGESATKKFFFDFTEKHRKVLNIMVRNNPSLMSGSFAVLISNPSVLDFDNKRNYFNQQLHKRQSREHYRPILITVRRQYVFEDSFHSIMRRSGEEVKYGKLNVRFYGEEGIDAGGVTREWFQVLALQMFNPDYALFQPCAADKLTYQPNRLSNVNPDHLTFFKFVGRVIGKAIYDNRLLDAYFTRSFYKHMLNRPVAPSDLESVDPDYYKSLQWMLTNDINGVIDLNFTVETEELGVHHVIELKPNGKDIPVTNENKHEYVRLVTEQRLTKNIQEQINSFLTGLYEIIPKELIQTFTDSELELLISGLPDIDVDEWRSNTTLQHFSPNSTTVSWFWRAVRSFTQEERAKLLQFVTGSSRVPLEGFGSLQGVQGNTKFTLTAAHKQGFLPTAHTCFNQLDLPDYSSYEELREKLLQAITLGVTGFGFA